VSNSGTVGEKGGNRVEIGLWNYERGRELASFRFQAQGRALTGKVTPKGVKPNWAGSGAVFTEERREGSNFMQDVFRGEGAEIIA